MESIGRIEKDLNELKAEVQKHREHLERLQDRTIVIEESLKSAHKRFIPLEKNYDAMIELATEMKYTTKQINQIVDLLSKLEDRMMKAEKEHGNAAIKIVYYIVFAVLGGLISHFMNTL